MSDFDKIDLKEHGVFRTREAIESQTLTSVDGKIKSVARPVVVVTFVSLGGQSFEVLSVDRPSEYTPDFTEKLVAMAHPIAKKRLGPEISRALALAALDEALNA